MTSYRAAFAGLGGFVFAIGLGVGGMTNPAKVSGFLDVAGSWDPSLAFVMLGAIAVHSVVVASLRPDTKPLWGRGFRVSSRTGVDGRLLGGAALFGVGWGLAGYCPGPAVASLGILQRDPLLFSTAMIAGMALHTVVFERAADRTVTEGDVPADVDAA